MNAQATIRESTPVIEANIFRRARKGQERLWKAYWGHLLLGTFIVSSAAIILLPIAALFDISLSIVAIPIIPYLAFATLCVWRCAFNCDWRGWGYVARVQLIALWVALPFLLV
jgi:hypothetical protein